MSKKNLIWLFVVFLIGFIILFLLLSKKEKTTNTEIIHRDFTHIKKEGRIHIVTNTSHLGFKIERGEIKGFSYEIVKQFANQNDLELEVILVNDLDSALLGIKNHEYDIIALPIPNTTFLNKEVAFTEPFFTTRQMLVQSTKKESINPQELLKQHTQLNEQTIYVQRKSPQITRLENLQKESVISFSILEVPNITIEELVIGVSNGDVPLTICDELQIDKLKETYPHLNSDLPIGFQQKYGWIVNKNSTELLTELNKFLSDFKISKEYLDIYSKYY